MLSEQEKYKAYKKVLQARRNVLWATFYGPGLIMLVGALFRFSDQTMLVYLPLIWLPIVYFSLFYLEVKTICPWCTQSFFRDKQSFSDAFLLMFSRQCGCCGEPKAESDQRK